jgi:hypothetical protein
VLWPGRTRVHRRTAFGDQGVRDFIGRAKPESIFDAWEPRLNESIQMKGEYIPECESESLGENPYSRCQTEMLKNDRTPYPCTGKLTPPSGLLFPKLAEAA